MDSQFHRILWGWVFLLLFFVTSCSLQTVKRPEGEKEFYQETSRLEKSAREHPETSVILLDVVMESEHAGLDACREFKLARSHRVVLLRTCCGHPGEPGC